MVYRVKTIMALGNWVLGNICRLLLLDDILGIFFTVTPNTIPTRQQSAPSTIHMITILTSLVWMLSADDVRESGEG